ncbi:MAG: HD-GYP domain-containing protein [Oleiphilaceae bacterium]|nr:HD-GYP domain-containing protein [Oleiphilaceae bacterium]
MLKKIAIGDLTVDMYVAELIAGPGAAMPKKKKGMVRDPRIIAKFVEVGIEHVVIDTARGLDVIDLPPANEAVVNPSQYVDQVIQGDLAQLMEETSTHYRELRLEWGTAKEVFDTSVAIVSNTIEAVKDGKSINPEYFRQAASAISRSVLRNKDALTWLGKFRDINSYLYEHSVNCAVLMGIFAHANGFNALQVEQCITGALLHDLGEALVDSELFERSGPLSPEEYEQIQQHVFFGQSLVQDVENVEDIAIRMIEEHHERVDGSGYPMRLKGKEISVFGRMLAIVDTYDAVTNNRTYKEAVPSSVGMRTLLESCNTHFDESLVHVFIKCMGVYPTGSLVKLSNGMLAVVIAQIPGAPLKPLVRTIYNLKSAAYVEPRLTDLSLPNCELKVVSYEDPRKYKIDVYEFMPTEYDF